VFVFTVIIIFIAVAFVITKSVFTSQIGNLFGGYSFEDVQVTTTTYACPLDTNLSTGYVYVRGYGDHNPNTFSSGKELISNAPFFDFDYDPSRTLSELSAEFIYQFNTFAQSADVEKLIIFAHSAGGVIASFSANKLIFEGVLEVHTLASPLNGYHLSESLIDYSGFAKEIALGFWAFTKPDENVRVYHHKTVEDASLRSWCAVFSRFCDPLKIQNNNVPGSAEYYYPEQNHISIVSHVSNVVINCYA